MQPVRRAGALQIRWEPSKDAETRINVPRQAMVEQLSLPQFVTRPLQGYMHIEPKSVCPEEKVRSFC